MKKIITLALLINLTLSLKAQDNPYREFRSFVSPSFFFIGGKQKEENKLEDQKKMYYNNGKLRSEFTIVNNFLEGSVIEYYETGQIRLKGNYKASEKHGKQEVFFKSGELMGVYNYKEDVLIGESKEFLKNGKIRRKLRYIKDDNDSIIGVLEKYSYQRAKKVKVGEIGSKKVSILNVPEKNMLVYKFSYTNGKPNGDQIYYNKKGEKEEVRKYKDGSILSHYFFDVEGKLSMEKHYGPGDSEQKWRSYYSNGKIKKIFYKDEAITIDSVFYKNGNMKKIQKTNHDYILEEKKFFRNKVLKSLIKSIETKEGRLRRNVLYYKNGNIESEFNYNRRGKAVGEWKTFYENGNNKCFNKISKDMEVEECYYENGNRKDLESYFIQEGKKKLKHGVFKYFYENGKLIREFEWNKNRLMNAKGWFTEEGKKLNIGNLKNGKGKVIYYNDLYEIKVIKEYEEGKVIDSYYE